MPHDIKVDIKTKDLARFAVAWQSWKIVAVGGVALLLGSLVGGFGLLVAIIVADGPMFNKYKRIKSEEYEYCVAVNKLKLGTYTAYSYCEGISAEAARKVKLYDDALRNTRILKENGIFLK